MNYSTEERQKVLISDERSCLKKKKTSRKKMTQERLANLAEKSMVSQL
jgi:hypothetical protein